MGRAIAILIGLVALQTTTSAFAGAWTLAKGDGQVIVSGLYSEAQEAFDSESDPYAIPVFRKAEVSVYAEFGVTDWLTALVRTELKTEATGTAMALSDARLGLSGLGARARLWQGQSGVVSAEISGRIPMGNEADRWEGEPDGDVDLRLLAGYGLVLGDWTGFVDMQAAYRLRPGASSDEIRADLTLGLRPRPRLLWMAQSFNTLSTDSEDFGSSTEHKAAVSIVYDVTEHVSVQLGGIATVAGKNALRERGLITALWLRF